MSDMTLKEELKNENNADAVGITEKGEYVISEGMIDDLLEGIDSLTTEQLEKGKHTYCCTMGDSDGIPRERQQFRAYSWQAPLFCMRMARNNGWAKGSVSRGECNPNEGED